MTKRAEIKLLKRLIKKYADDTYLGMFLARNQEIIIAAIKNDLPIETELFLRMEA